MGEGGKWRAVTQKKKKKIKLQKSLLADGGVDNIISKALKGSLASAFQMNEGKK